MTKEDPHNWDKQLLTTLMGYCTTRQASTKYSPFFMLHGHEMVLPINNKGRTVSVENGELSESFIADQFGPSKAVLDDALANISDAQAKQMATYAKKQLHGAMPNPIVAAPNADLPKPLPKATVAKLTSAPETAAPNTVTADIPSSSRDPESVEIKTKSYYTSSQEQKASASSNQ